MFMLSKYVHIPYLRFLTKYLHGTGRADASLYRPMNKHLLASPLSKSPTVHRVFPEVSFVVLLARGLQSIKELLQEASNSIRRECQ